MNNTTVHYCYFCYEDVYPSETFCFCNGEYCSVNNADYNLHIYNLISEDEERYYVATNIKENVNCTACLQKLAVKDKITIHYAKDYNNMPGIKILCSKKGHNYTMNLSGLPQNVFCTSENDYSYVIYTFDEDKITCKDCLDRLKE